MVLGAVVIELQTMIKSLMGDRERLDNVISAFERLTKDPNAPKRRGRPLGSGNKTKAVTARVSKKQRQVI